MMKKAVLSLMALLMLIALTGCATTIQEGAGQTTPTTVSTKSSRLLSQWVGSIVSKTMEETMDAVYTEELTPWIEELLRDALTDAYESYDPIGFFIEEAFPHWENWDQTGDKQKMERWSADGTELFWSTESDDDIRDYIMGEALQTWTYLYAVPEDAEALCQTVYWQEYRSRPGELLENARETLYLTPDGRYFIRMEVPYFSDYESEHAMVITAEIPVSSGQHILNYAK